MPVDAALTLSAPKRIHIIGIGGAGMSGLAQVLHAMGHQVAGSDLTASAVTRRLQALGIEVAIGHDAANVGAVDLITASPAVGPDNPELVAARAAGIAVAHRSAILAAISRMRPTIAIAGTHGKTTTSSMVALILIAAGMDPSYLIGADLIGASSNAHWGSGEVLVLEADESYGSFTSLSPWITGITNVEADHLDHYGTLEALEAAFGSLLERSSGSSVVMAWDEGAARVGAAFGAVAIGGDEVRVDEIELHRATSSFRLHLETGPLSLSVGAPGRHNVANASVAAYVAHLAGVSDEAIVAGLASFAGVPRRFEFRGHRSGVTFVDDYAHLPTEVAATVQAAKAGDYQRIIAVFQPHRYTRTQAVGAQFANSFVGADEIVITDIYSAGEEPIPGITGRVVFEAVVGASSVPVHYVSDVDEAAALVGPLLREGDLCLSLGAGNITDLADSILGVRDA